MLTTRKSKTVLLAATGLAAAMMCAPALAQEATTTATPQPTVAATADDIEAVVIVKGMRKSLKSAVDRKRNSKQIVDSIDAEDAGKLPDNNVIEALAHVTGVQIDRARGEGAGISIRGQTDVQTTVNGIATSTGQSRSSGLNDIPAELLKSVQVYKTRTADQVEGGIAGTVNVDLRRPLDLPKGWTLAGSVRNVYADVGSTESPYGSVLIANRFDTPVGEMGFLVNASYQEVNFNEQFVESETPRPFWGTQLDSLPEDQKDTIGVYKARYGIERGKVRRPSLNVALQWRANDNLDFVLEGSILNAKENRAQDQLIAQLKDGPGVLSNIVYQPDGVTLKSATITDPNPTDGNTLPVGPLARDTIYTRENYLLNFETHWRSERITANASVSLNNSHDNNEWYQQQIRLPGLTSFNIDLDSDKTPGGGPYVEYTGVDMSDPNSYNLREIENGKSYADSETSTWSADLTYRISDDKFLRTIQVGVRRETHDLKTDYGYRYAGFEGDRQILLPAFPGGDGVESVSIDVPGYDTPSWYRISRESFLGNFDAIRALANDPTKRSYYGGSGDQTIWSTPVVSTEVGFSSFTSHENTAAIFGQFTYAFKVWDFPVDGVIGGRQVHTWGDSLSSRTSYSKYVPASPATDTTPATPEKPVVSTITPVPSEGDYTDFLPSVNAIVHFSQKLQLRLAYTENVQRPSFQESSAFVSVDNNCNCGWGGNADLRANHETSYDASLEYYFGRGGLLSFATYLKKPDGFVTWSQEDELFDNGDGSGPQIFHISRPRNAGPGKFQGYEFAAQGFFDFLPGKWANLGASVNATYNQTAEIKFQYSAEDIARVPGIYDALGNSKYTYNLALYYDTPQFSARVAYNYRDRFRASVDAEYPQYSLYNEPTSRLDAAINWTPIKQLTLSLEGTNILGDDNKMYWGQQRLVPQGVRIQAKTVQLSARFRY